MKKSAKLTGKALYEVKLQTVRVCEEPAPVCSLPGNIVQLWRSHITQASWFEPAREQMVLFTLDTRHRCTGYFLIAIGTLNECTAHPREILRPALLAGAYGFVLTHNHPSGASSPSEADRALTRRIREGADLLCVHMLDHIIIGEPNTENGTDIGHFSFREHGII